jgi:hypothetical protein
MNKSIFVVSHKTRVPFGFDCDDEEFEVVRAFSSYAKAFKYVQTKCPDIYRGHNREFRNKAYTHLYKIDELDLD